LIISRNAFYKFIIVAKNINGFDLSFNANQSFAENSDQEAKVLLSKKF